MFCGKCGAQNADNAVFCKVCGAPLTPQQGANGGMNGGMNSGMNGGAGGPAPDGRPAVDKHKLIGIVAICAVAVLVIVLIAVLVGGSGASGVVKKYYKAIYVKQDGEAYADLFHDDVIKEYVDYAGTTRKKWINEMTDSFEERADYLDEEYDKWNYKLKILDVESVTEDTFDELDEEYDETYDLNLKDAAYVTIKLTWVYDGETQESTVGRILVVKIGSKWYLDETYV